MAGFTPSGGEANVPGWVEDENSPFTGDGTGPVTCSLSTGYDHILVDINVLSGTTNNTVEMQVNGFTNGYTYISVQGSATAGASAIPLMAGGGDTGFVGTVKASFFDGADFGSSGTGMAGRPQTVCSQNNSTLERSSTFASKDISSRLSQVTITDSNNDGINGEIEVYGRNR